MAGLELVEGLIRAEIEILVPGIDPGRISLNRPRDGLQCDLTTPVALALAKTLARAPFELAEALAAGLATREPVAAAEAIPPGFINFDLRQRFWADSLAEILAAGTAYGRAAPGGLCNGRNGVVAAEWGGAGDKSSENPGFSVQWAHARCRSVLRHAAVAVPAIDLAPQALAAGPLDSLTDSDELGLIKQLVEWPRILEGAAEARDPQRIAAYLYDLAANFHSLWSKGAGTAELRFLLSEASVPTAARLALVQAVALVIATGLRTIGVEPLEELR